MDNIDEIIEKVNDIFVESFEIDPEAILPEANLFVDLGLDSLDIVDLVVALQQAFGIEIREDERIRSIRTLNDIYEFIKLLQEDSGK